MEAFTIDGEFVVGFNQLGKPVELASGSGSTTTGGEGNVRRV
ncbi:hypothetical protein CASFOL_032335 [Castilleja foliolosa]|uniref:Uncharacterized protein n=1 Tax=Castilleja foliolosa TaxID=1961234 RepID=A0ABD3C1R8_9LAMI